MKITKQQTIIFLLFASYALLLAVLSVKKFLNFQAQGIDLAIFNQVAFNTVQGNLFQYSFHGETYLQDHFTPFFLTLIPIYKYAQHPITLLILQACAVASTIIPLAKVAKTTKTKIIASLIVIVNPFMLAVTLDEFHVITFAIPLISWLLYFFHINKFTPAITFLLLTLTIREDMFLVGITLSLLALISKKEKKWIITPIAISVLYGIIAFSILKNFQGDTYKFIELYSNLGNSFTEIIFNPFINSAQFFGKIVNAQMLVFIMYILSPSVFISLKKPKLLLATAPFLLQYGLSNPGILDTINSHYLATFIPFTLFATVIGLQEITQKSVFKKFEKIGITLVIILVSAALTIGTTGIININLVGNSATRSLLQTIPADNKVISSNTYLPHLSSREYIFPLQYILRGTNQFENTELKTPTIDTLALNPTETMWLTYFYNNQNTTTNLQKLINKNELKVAAQNENVLLLTPNGTQKPFSITKSTPVETFTIHNMQAIKNSNQVELQSEYQTNKTNQNIQIELTLLDSNDTLIRSKIIPITHGILPTNQWNEGQIITTKYHINDSDNSSKICINPVTLEHVQITYTNTGIKPAFETKNIFKAPQCAEI